MKSLSIMGFTALGLAALASGAGAQIIGGSNLINNNDLTQLEAWLGEGELKITNIFDHTMGDGKTGGDFHNASDNMGRTFNILRDEQTGRIFGGYNPLSWEGNINDYHYGNNPPAWLFNLSTNVKRDQRNDGQGQYQTYNNASYGPTFGGGHDIYVPNDLTNGYVYPYTYDSNFNFTNIINDGGYENHVYTDLEVFTIEIVPAPGSAALLGLGGLIAARRRRSHL